MTEFVKELERATNNGDKVRVMVVLNDILEYAIAQADGDLIQRTLDTIYIMKEEETEMLNNNNNNVDLSLNGINKEEQTMKMNLQFFAIKVEEEVEMLKQIEKFKDIAKQIEEIDAVGGEVYVGGFKVSWEAVKQFVYGLSDDELRILAYSNKPEIPVELEAFAIYLLEAEKAWDNELTLQNAYFNSKKHL